MFKNKSKEEFKKLTEYGLYLAPLSKEIGMNSGYLSELAYRNFTPSDDVIDSLKKSLKKRGVFLLSFDPRKHTVQDLFSRANVNLNFLANRIGVSRQAINKNAISEDKVAELTTEVRKLGETLVKLAR